MSAALIFLGCEKMDPVSPDLDQTDQEMAVLKGAMAGNTFEGICTNVLTNEEVNEWYDATDNWKTTGSSFWVQPDQSVFEGTCTLILDPRNSHEESAGKWAMTWEGSMTFLEDGSGAYITAKAEGVGVEGKVKGLEATWTYTMNWVFADPETFVYAVEGKIVPPGHTKNHKHKY